MLKWWILCVVLFFANASGEINWEFELSKEVSDFSDPLIGCSNNNCTKCPGRGEICTGCCKGFNLVCFNNICQECYVNQKWKCSSHQRNQEILMTATQVAMSAALILGILTIFILLWKICTKRNERPIPRRRLRRRIRDSLRSGRSVDTLQQIVTERLRDAPPPYTRAVLPPPGDTPPPYAVSGGHVNTCFDPDYNADPPSYSVSVNQEQTLDGDKPEEPAKINDTTDLAMHI